MVQGKNGSACCSTKPMFLVMIVDKSLNSVDQTGLTVWMKPITKQICLNIKLLQHNAVPSITEGKDVPRVPH